MKKNLCSIVLLLASISQCLFAQSNAFPFLKINESEVVQKPLERRIVPQKYEVYRLDISTLQKILSNAPKRQFPQQTPSDVLLSLPMPDGQKQDFAIYYDPIMEKGLEDKFPEIKTYCGYGLTDKSAYVRFDFTPTGFHAMVLANDKEPLFIDPYYFLDNQYYSVYWKNDFARPADKIFNCGFDDLEENIELLKHKMPKAIEARAGDCGNLRTYRLALTCSVEYSNFCGATVALTQSAMTTTMNRVNGVYERDFSVHMNFVADNWKNIYCTTASGPLGTTIYTTATDPFTNGNGSTMLNENQTTCNANIGTANYDIGHVFSTGGGGVAQLNSPCGTSKARGVTGSSSPVGDPFDIDYVAHEMGHQFGGPHTFAAGSSATGSCSSGNVSSANAYEPGSGTTIQAYAGICTGVNVQPNSDAYFHAGSLASMMAFITGTGNGCAVVTATGNTAPTANAGLDYSIPISTPFILTGVGADPNGDPFTSCWEQMDAAVISTAPTGTATTGSLFRSLSPVTSQSRTIPKIADIASNATTTWEKLSSVARNINMRYTVRDNNPSGGCTAEDNMRITTVTTTGPFVITYPTATGVTWSGLSNYTVTWNVVGTDVAPISSPNVRILLSTDGGLTYPTVLAASVPNNGSAAVTCPNTPSTTARIRVESANNIFFDISNNNFTIVLGGPNYNISSTNASQTSCTGIDLTYNITTSSLLSYTDPINFTVSGLPNGTLVSFSNNNVTPGTPLSLTVFGTNSLVAGTYSFNVNTSSTAGAKSLVLTMILYSSGAAGPTLSAPASNAVAISRTPTFTWAASVNALSYDIQVSSDVNFNTIVAANTSSIATTSFTSPVILLGNTTYWWRVKSNNNCGVSGYGVPISFTTEPTACITKPSGTTPVTISATGAPIVYSIINVTESGTLTDVNVLNINGTHSWIADLKVSIKSPLSTTYVILWNALCGSNANFNINFDDQATSNYSTIACPMTGGLRYKPNALLSTFNGQEMQGTWTLKIEDVSNNDGGALNGWSPEVCAQNLVLPVTFVDFKTASQRKNILLDWQTTAEINNKGFEIQRSDDFNTGFRTLDFVAAQNSKNAIKHYQYIDNEVVVGKTYYYRLRQLDNEGREMFSATRAANLDKSGLWDIAISPNPVHDFFRLSVFSKNEISKQVEIATIDGKTIKRFDTIENELNIEVEGLAQGLYFIKVASEGEQFVKKFLKN